MPKDMIRLASTCKQIYGLIPQQCRRIITIMQLNAKYMNTIRGIKYYNSTPKIINDETRHGTIIIVDNRRIFYGVDIYYGVKPQRASYRMTTRSKCVAYIYYHASITYCYPPSSPIRYHRNLPMLSTIHGTFENYHEITSIIQSL